MLKITKLNVNIDVEQILEDIDLEVNEGEIHAILGPRESGKSALAHTLMGHPNLTVVKGKINFKRRVMSSVSPDERAKMGMFLSFQDPPEIPGITNLQFVSDVLEARDEKKELTSVITSIKDLSKKFDLGAEWHSKGFNVGVTTAEARRSELLQMNLLDPSLIILDDIDDNLEENVVTELASEIASFLKKKGKAGIIITHNATILKTIKPTHVHVMVDGKIVKTGDRRIIKGIIENGYRKFS